MGDCPPGTQHAQQPRAVERFVINQDFCLEAGKQRITGGELASRNVKKQAVPVFRESPESSFRRFPLEVAEDISENQKHGWEIAKLGKDLGKSFNLGNTIVQITFFNAASSKEWIIYHTPVSEELHKQGQQLGNYLHAMKAHREPMIRGGLIQIDSERIAGKKPDRRKAM